jgi:GAF domain-containing protein
LDYRLEYERFQVLHSLHLLTTLAPRELQDLCCRIRDRFGVAAVLVTLIHGDRQVAWARAGTDLEGTPRSDAFCDHLLGSDEVLVVPDAAQDPRFSSNPLVTGEPFIRFYAGAPLLYSRAVRLGGLCLLDTEPREFLSSEQTELAELADEVMFRILERELQNVAHLQ